MTQTYAIRYLAQAAQPRDPGTGAFEEFGGALLFGLRSTSGFLKSAATSALILVHSEGSQKAAETWLSSGT